MTGEKLLKKLSILCYILGVAGIIIGVIAMTTNLGDTLFEGYMENYQIGDYFLFYLSFLS